MGYYVTVEGSLKVEGDLTSEQIKTVESIKNEKRGKTIFSVFIEDAIPYISFVMDEMEGLTPFTDYIEKPLDELLKVLGNRIKGEFVISSDSSEYDGAIIEVSDGGYTIGDSSLSEASDDALKLELKKRGIINDFCFLNLKPDLCSDINIDDEESGEVSVVVTGNIDQNFKLLFGVDTEYVDMYAIIDASTELVTRINVVATYEDDKDYMDIAITNPAMQARLFSNIKAADVNGKLEEVLTEARASIHQHKLDFIGARIDDIEDFLSEQGVILPRSKEAQDEGEMGGYDAVREEPFYVSIYGEDYDVLSMIFEDRLGISEERKNIKWFKAYYEFSKQPDSGVDEADFVAMAIERGVDRDTIYKAYDGDMTLVYWFEKIAEEHGLI